jgi:hypothetical protein
MNLRVITYPILIVFIAFLLNQTGKSKRPVDAEFKKYVREIKVLYKECGKKHLIENIDNVAISFQKLPDHVYAQCYMFLNRIEVNKLGWDFLEDYEREELLLHEFGHCVLKQFDETGETIMKGKGGMLGIKYTQNYNHYINEYFGCTKKKCCNVRYDWNKYND